MGAEGARRSTGPKGSRRKILSILQPNTILNPNPDPNTPPPSIPPLQHTLANIPVHRLSSPLTPTAMETPSHVHVRQPMDPIWRA